jgi:hypothetical protein
VDWPDPNLGTVSTSLLANLFLPEGTHLESNCIILTFGAETTIRRMFTVPTLSKRDVPLAPSSASAIEELRLLNQIIG